MAQRFQPVYIVNTKPHCVISDCFFLLTPMSIFHQAASMRLTISFTLNFSTPSELGNDKVKHEVNDTGGTIEVQV